MLLFSIEDSRILRIITEAPLVRLGASTPDITAQDFGGAWLNNNMNRRTTITQLAYVGIGVKDSAAWENFGVNVLGLGLSEKLDDGTMYLRQDEYSHRFIIEPTGEDDLKYAGWMTPTMESFHDVEDRLRAAGVAFEEGSPEECAYRKVVRFIVFKDPNGVRTEVCYGLHVLADEPFHSPRNITGFKAGNLGLGHILIGVNDVDESENFYRDVLGLRVSDYIYRGTPGAGGSKLCFLHTETGRHHSLAFGTMGGPKRINHFMIEAKSMHDVGLTFDVAKEQGVPIRSGLGVHSNDHMFSFYMVNPSGFGVEYGWGARVVDDKEWVVQSHHTANVWGHHRPDPVEAPASAR